MRQCPEASIIIRNPKPMKLTPENIRPLLYEDAQGEVIGLDEVQLLDPIPEHRIPLLRQLMNGQDKYLAVHAAQVLAAWGKTPD
jgi:hypothetical protein